MMKTIDRPVSRSRSETGNSVVCVTGKLSLEICRLSGDGIKAWKGGASEIVFFDSEKLPLQRKVQCRWSARYKWEWYDWDHWDYRIWDVPRPSPCTL